MTKLLLKLFIKDYDNIKDTKVRTGYGVLASTVGIICNIILFIIKFAIGFFINSISVIGDAFNNLSDASSSIIGLVGIKIAERPADKEHPFGHGRAEYIASFVVAFFILQVGFSVFKNSVSKILTPESVIFSWPIILILVISVLIKLWLSLFNSKIGRRIDSNVMKATAADSLSDVLVTSATIFSILIERILGYSIDGWMGLIVSGFVILSGINIAKETLLPLMGEPVDREVYKKITKKVKSYDGIIGSHGLIVHNYGPSHTMATIHAEVPNDVDIEQIHETIDLIEKDILKEMDIFLVIHMDPIEVKDERVLEKKEMITKIVTTLEPEASIHDFRVIQDGGQINLNFDLVVPHSYKEKQEHQLIMKIIEEAKKSDDRIQCIISIENSYIAES